MIFSSVLKTRLKGFLRKVESAVDLAVAIVDEDDCALVKSDHFRLEWLKSKTNGKIRFEQLECQGCHFKIAGKPLGHKLSDDRVTKLYALIRENVEFLISMEQEAQGLAQEVLEKYEELNLLYDLIAELSVIFDEKKICQITLEKAMRVLNVGSGAIFLKTDDSHNLTLICSANNEDLQIVSSPDKLIEFAQKSIDDGKELLIDDKKRLPKWYFDRLKNKNLWTLLAVPILASDKILGTLVLIGKIGEDTFQSGDIKLAEALAGYAGITINSNRMVEKMRAAEALRHEMKLARNIQQSLLPRTLPETKKFEICGVCEPATDVGGDYFSVKQIQDGKWEIVIADVSGHGIGAALTMASLRSILHSESRLRNKVDEVLENANHLMCQDTEETGMYATMVLARFDEKTGQLFYCNAGHQNPILWRSDMEKFEWLDSGSLPVGMFEEETYQQKEIQLNPGDFLMLFTDGVTEARDANNKLFGEERLLAVLKKNTKNSAKQILKNIVAEVREFQKSDLQRDDITIVILKIK